MKDTVQSAKIALSKFRADNYHIDIEIEGLIEFKQDNDIRRYILFNKNFFINFDYGFFGLVYTYVCMVRIN